MHYSAATRADVPPVLGREKAARLPFHGFARREMHRQRPPMLCSLNPQSALAHRLIETFRMLVVVALDEMDHQRLSDQSTETNMHSLRALWTKEGNFWDIQVRHDGCPVACEFSADQSLLPRADAILFSMQVFPGLGYFEEVMAQRLEAQTTILWSTEASQNYRLGPQLPLLSSMVDVTATYELDSDIPVVSFPSSVSPQDFTDPVPQVSQDGRALVVWVASNCETTPNKRTEYVRELMHYMKVDSYGRCLHTKDLPEGFESERSGSKFWQDKVRLLQGYRFALVTENTNAADYVTEKLFQALLAGTVPIYMGAKNVDVFLPDGDAVIDARNFSPQDLATHLNRLASDDEAYSKMLSWRKRHLPERFRRLWNWSWDTAKCRICRRVAATFQPQSRINASLAAASDWKGMLKRGCEAEDGCLPRLAERLYKAAHFLSPLDEIAKTALERIRSLQKHVVAVDIAGHKYQVHIPAGNQSLCDELKPRAEVDRCRSAVNPGTVMLAVDSFCLEFHLPFGPECQSVFTTVGLYLERRGMPVWPSRPWKSKELLGSSATLCQLLHDSFRSPGARQAERVAGGEL